MGFLSSVSHSRKSIEPKEEVVGTMELNNTERILVQTMAYS